MSELETTAEVVLWGTRIGAVTWVAEQELGYFQYDKDFLSFGIDVAPLKMPLQEEPYVFRSLERETFKGLPGMLADVLPDKFGNRLIDAWLAQQSRTPESFNPVERLCYVGTRGMGALEFLPVLLPARKRSKTLELSRLVELANVVLDERTELIGRFEGENDQEALEDILRVGTSAGGARAKAVLAWNPDTNEFRSGQIEAGQGFEHWLLKFDGVANNRDKELADPLGFGLIEYAYYEMALKAGIKMNPCRLHEEGGRSHFMTKRFDRVVNDDGEHDKLHMQSLCAMQHYDFNDRTGYSYEQAMLTISELDLGRDAEEEQFRRAVFNVIARNQDDHVKNIAYLMDRSGNWSLAPAYDMTYSYNPTGDWTSNHQMSINGRRSLFELSDLVALAKVAGIKPKKAKDVVAEVKDAVRMWPQIATKSGVTQIVIQKIAKTHRLGLIPQ
jgi:serine/threonine-protein kinase HipA